jgi:SAM-dependent methyltransferase
MSFHSLMIRLVAELRPELPSAPRVLELGNQTFRPRPGDLEIARQALRSRGQLFDESLLRGIDQRTGSELDASTADYYRAIGFAEYKAVDVNGRYGSLIMDLNKDVSSAYGFSDSFDLVTNNGTGEHIFNQHSVFSNIHNLCRPDGLMLHCLPFFNWLNHGFYNFNPLLFIDLAAANGYEILRLSVASNHGAEIGAGPLAGKTEMIDLNDLQARCAVGRDTASGPLSGLLSPKRKKRTNRPLSRALQRIVRKAGPHVSVVAILRKKARAPFRLPIQGMYGETNIEDAGLRSAYAKAEHSA